MPQKNVFLVLVQETRGLITQSMPQPTHTHFWWWAKAASRQAERCRALRLPPPPYRWAGHFRFLRGRLQKSLFAGFAVFHPVYKGFVTSCRPQRQQRPVGGFGSPGSSDGGEGTRAQNHNAPAPAVPRT